MKPAKNTNLRSRRRRARLGLASLFALTTSTLVPASAAHAAAA